MKSPKHFWNPGTFLGISANTAEEHHLMLEKVLDVEGTVIQDAPEHQETASTMEEPVEQSAGQTTIGGPGF